MGEICARHDVLVIADEIHEDLSLDPGRKHTPFASLGPESAQTASPAPHPARPSTCRARRPRTSPSPGDSSMRSPSAGAPNRWPGAGSGDRRRDGGRRAARVSSSRRVSVRCRRRTRCEQTRVLARRPCPWTSVVPDGHAWYTSRRIPLAITLQTSQWAFRGQQELSDLELHRLGRVVRHFASGRRGQPTPSGLRESRLAALSHRPRSASAAPRRVASSPDSAV
jgi:hypothetical protein